MATLTRTYTINIRKAMAASQRYRRTKKAMYEVLAFIRRHMKTDDVKIGPYLNEHLWQNGIQNPPTRFTVTIIKEDKTAYAELEGHDPLAIKGLTKESREKAQKAAEKQEKKLKQEEKDVKDALGKKAEKKTEEKKE